MCRIFGGFLVLSPLRTFPKYKWSMVIILGIAGYCPLAFLAFVSADYNLRLDAVHSCQFLVRRCCVSFGPPRVFDFFIPSISLAITWGTSAWRTNNLSRKIFNTIFIVRISLCTGQNNVVLESQLINVTIR